MNASDILTLGRMFPEDTERTVIADSRSMISSAAHAHLSKIITGLDENLDTPVKIINVMPVGSYPRRYRRLFVRGFLYAHTEGAADENVGYCNLTGWKQLSMAAHLRRRVRAWAKDGKTQKAVIVYTPCAMFLSACRLIKRYVPDCHICVIVPDLPQYTDTEKGRSLIASFRAHRVQKLSETADSFVFLTEQMHEKFPPRPYIVSEAVSDSVPVKEIPPHDGLRYIAYTGTLRKKYGVMKLVRAFQKIGDDRYRLVICGSGEAAAEISELAAQDERIIYRGMLPLDEVRVLQAQATVLVNPRENKEEFTKYSFPSKLMEYLTAARPVLCFRLDGIPREYDAYLNYFSSSDEQTMADEMMRLCETDEAELTRMGQRGAEFVCREKNGSVQARRILELIARKHVLFVNNTLETGGTTTALQSLLTEIQETYRIDVLLAHHRGDLSLPAQVRLLPPVFGNRIAEKLRKLWTYIMHGHLYRAGRLQKSAPLARFQLMSGIAQTDAAARLKQQYDIAVGYMEGFADWYTAEKVAAKRKIGFLHVDYQRSGMNPELDAGLWDAFDRIVCVSPDCADSFCHAFEQYTEKTVTLENVVSQPFLRIRASNSAPCIREEGFFTVITAARLVNRHKRLDRAVYAHKRLKQNGYRVKWYVFGEGEDRAALEKQIAECGLEHDFFLMGNAENICPYLIQANLFILPSRYEGKPVAVTEAMALGTVPLVTEYASAREQIGEYGFVCPQSDDALYPALKEILDHNDMLVRKRERLRDYRISCDVGRITRILEGKDAD